MGDGACGEVVGEPRPCLNRRRRLNPPLAVAKRRAGGGWGRACLDGGALWMGGEWTGWAGLDRSGRQRNEGRAVESFCAGV